jgi:hypothetical protein
MIRCREIAAKKLLNFDVPQGIAHISDGVDEVAAWADKNQIARSRIMCGEFSDVLETSKVASMPRYRTGRRGCRHCVRPSRTADGVFTTLMSHFVLNDKFVPELLAALGLGTS